MQKLHKDKKNKLKKAQTAWPASQAVCLHFNINLLFKLLTTQAAGFMTPVFVCIFFDIGSEYRFAIQAKVRIHLHNPDKTEKAAARAVFQADITAFTAFSPCNTKFNARTSATRTIHIFTPVQSLPLL